MPGMPMDMRGLMAEKYRQSGLTAQAQANQANANAALQRQQAGVVKPLAESQMGLEKSQAGLNTANTEYRNKETERYDDVVDADIGFKNAGANKLNEEAAVVRPLAESTIGLNSSQAANLDMETANKPALYQAQANNLNMDTKYKPGLMSAQSSALLGEANLNNAQAKYYTGIGGQKRGLTRVPGKGEGDKVPALLEPGEAILNKKAAGMIGRDKIAKMNAKGNELRDEETLSKLVQAIKMAGMV